MVKKMWKKWEEEGKGGRTEENGGREERGERSGIEGVFTRRNLPSTQWHT